MRLTQLTVAGFKSFGNRASVEFSPGVTAIVGPNGSGKSNLLDALKWVTGGGRAREFRAESKTDLIFHGADGKRGMGYADVEVELSDGRRTIKVRRDLDREGASRLRLDGRAARFLDVDEALAGSGLGTSGVAMIGQGEVAGVLMADPSTLLGYVAEAAGVARLSGRREQTQARLDTARLHLARLEDVLLELRERIEHLRHEAAAAVRHADLSREALVLRVTAGYARVHALEAEVDGLRRDARSAEQTILEVREAAAGARAVADSLRSERTAVEAAYRDVLAAAATARGALDLARAEAARTHERCETLRRARDEALAEATRLEREPVPVAPDVDEAAARAAAETAQQAVVDAEAERTDAERAARAAEGHLERARTEAAAAEQAWAVYRGRHETWTQERAEVERERAELADPSDGAPTAVGALEAELAAAEARVATAEGALDEARRALESAHAEHATAHGEAAARGRAVERLRAAFEARRGYAQGPRAALTSGVPGIRGSVADLLRVDARYQAAIAGALGRRVEYVVVDTAATGERVLAAVRQAGGWATLLPLDLLRPPRAAFDADWGSNEGVVARAVDVVDVDPDDRSVAEQLLTNTFVVRDLPSATALARRHRDRPRLVTLDGDVLEASGAMSGGRRAGAGTVMGLGRDLEDAEAAASDAVALEVERRARLEAARARVREAQATAETERGQAEGARTAHAEARRRAERLAERRQALDLRAARLDEALQDLEPPSLVVDPDGLADAETRTSTARARADAARTVWERATEAAAGAQQAAAVGAERWRAFEAARDAYALARTRANALRESAQSLAEDLERAQHEAEGAQHAVEAARQALPQDVEERRVALETLDGRLADVEATARAHTEAQARAGESWETGRVALARREAALELALEERAGLPEGVAVLDLSERAARHRLREVEAAIEALGPVNHRAATDHAAQAERLASLEDEAAQAVEAVDTLSSTLETIDQETNARLGTALDGLRQGFAEHVRQLFGPTAVGAIEIEHEGPRPVGLRIGLQPPGKRTQSLNLLSVGERSMGALAFLFALMAGDGGGLPIAVLDEVDAPLDEANIRRFCGFVESLAALGTQFVLITHQKATFEVADTLWGVTTEAGVSRVFSLRRDDPRVPAPA